MAMIALVDDDQDCREILTIFLKYHGYSIQGFASAEDFLAWFKPGVLRLVLIDLSMPEMDGYELMKIVRQTDPSVQAMAVTALAYEVNRQKALAAGFSGFVTKPITNLDAFLNLITKHVSEDSM
jgi:CheY-like chemotaxis protein